jgi:WD40 repeat protein
VVREIFRNLVTAQGTRAVVDRDELLSAFPEKGVAEGVLRELIDARLVTSYEVEGREGEASRHRVEVVHESLLKAWPRLVRWQAQDEEGAVLRDQLKQAAHLWDEKGRTEDLLWSGTSFREYELWHERYAGALTALEEDFARCMAERAQRQRRRRRLAVGAVIAAALLVAAVTGGLWRKSEAARQRAAAAALRAEASKLLALGRLDLDTYPTAALAYARKSLELADTPEARKFALEVLWRGPVARMLPATQIGKERGLGDKGWIYLTVPSPDGRWLATARQGGERQILLFPKDGGPPLTLPRPPDGNAHVLAFGPQGNLLITGGSGESFRFWSLPDLREIRSIKLERGFFSRGGVRGGRLFTLTMIDEAKGENLLRAWPLPDGESKVLGTFIFDAWDIDAGGTWFGYILNRMVCVRPLDGPPTAPERVLGRARDELVEVAFTPKGDSLATFDKSGEIRLWSLAAREPALPRAIQGPKQLFDVWLAINGDGTLLANPGMASNLHVWDLRDPPDAEPVVLKWPDPLTIASGGFDPSGRWLAQSNGRTVAFWPIVGPWKRAYGIGIGVCGLDFSPDGRWLVSHAVGEAAVQLWPMRPAAGEAHTLGPVGPHSGIAFHPAGRHVLVSAGRKLLLVPIEGGQPRQLLDLWEGGTGIYRVAIDGQGRRAVAAMWSVEPVTDPKQRVLRVWDLESGQEQIFSFAPFTDASWRCEKVAFAPDGAVFVGGNGGVLRLVLPDDPNGAVSAETVYAGNTWGFDLTRDGRHLLVPGTRATSNPVYGCEELLLFDLVTHTSRQITTHGRRLSIAAFDPSGRNIVSGDMDGVVRAGPATGEEPHLLLGHAKMLNTLTVSPDGRWIVSASDEAVYLWPMPDVSKPPFHTLPHSELIAKLRALTNLQVVEDKTTATGWKLEIGPFPGWKDVPTW